MLTASPHSSKKVLLLNILDILRRYTDQDHRLSQREIADILRTEYNMTVDRKAVKRNLMDLIDFGYEVEYSESVRMTPDPRTGRMEENHILSDFYLSREFTDGELRLLIDSLLFSRHVPYSQCKQLVEKLEGLSNVYFRSRVKHIFRMPEDRTDNQQIFLNIERLDEAISKGRKVSFRYTEYGTDKKQHCRTRPDGTVRAYTVSPYQMAAKEGKYYLICNYDKYDDISNYRLDRIRDLTVLDEPIKPYESLRWAGGRPLDLAEYMKKHVYMYSSGDRRAKLRIVRPMVSDVIAMFGTDVTFSDEDEGHVTVTVHANEMSVEQFARSFAPDVIVLEPQALADRLAAGLEQTLAIYRGKLTGRKGADIIENTV